MFLVSPKLFHESDFRNIQYYDKDDQLHAKHRQQDLSF